MTRPRIAEEVRLRLRGVLRLSGPDVVNFLQGLLTNDVKKLKPGAGLGL